MEIKPDFRYERQVRRGFLVVGVDEVGRGALAGPVVAGAVALPNTISKKDSPFSETGVDDSKRLSSKRREELAKMIKKSAFWGIGEVGVAYINRWGIVKATEKAMRMALRQAQGKLPGRRLFVLVDAFHVKYIPGVGLKNQKAIIKGDQKSISIAAASIIAKVYRDRLMRKYHRQGAYKRYGLSSHKGYGTVGHRSAILKYGLTKLHRLQFCRGLV